MSTIEACIEVNKDQVVPCINVLRSALGLGLRETKELYYYLLDRGEVKVRCTEQQFGMLLLGNALNPVWLILVHYVRHVQEAPRDYIVLGEPLV